MFLAAFSQLPVIVRTVTELNSAIVSQLDESSALASARETALHNDLTPLSPIATSLVTMVARLARVSNAVVISDSAAVASLAIGHGITEGGVVTLINAQPEIVEHTRTTFKTENLPCVQLRPITGLPLEVFGRLADDSYDLVLVEDMYDKMGIFVEESARLLREGGLLVLPNSLADGNFLEMMDPSLATSAADEAAIAATTLAEMLEESADFTAYRLPIDLGMTIAVRT